MATLNGLIKNLGAADKPVELMTGPDGTRILVLPHGGRVLGLFAAGSDENFLWTHPMLDAVDSARALYRSEDWHNSGGDRVWLAPEADFFFPHFPDTSVYRQPRQFDPGQYQVERSGDGVRLTNGLTLRSFRAAEDIALRITRTVEPATNPLRHERLIPGQEELRFAGYALRTTLELAGGKSRTAVGLWNLLQMPHGGQMLIPTYSRTEPRVYFGRIEASDLAVEDRLVRYTMRAPGEAKIGVRAIATTGRAGYLYFHDSESCLVIRNFSVDPSGTYVDYPLDAPDDLGWAFQACNVSNEKLGSFSELEYHVPGIGGATGIARCEDVSEVWAFRGKAGPIRAVAGLLLGANYEA